MARAAAGKHKTTKFVFVLVGLLGLFLIVDLLWGSSSSPSSNWIVPDPPNIIDLQPLHPNNSALNTPIKEKHKPDKKDVAASGRVLSATFADLDAPDLDAPLVHSHVDIYNFTDNTWGGRFDMPKEMAHSHLGMVTDGRYIYVVTGQYGPQC